MGYLSNFTSSAGTIAANTSRGIYQGAREWAAQIKTATRFSSTMGVVGLGFTFADMGYNGRTTSNSLDFIFGVASFGGPWGGAVAGLYFGANAFVLGRTGKDPLVNMWMTGFG